MRKFVVQILTSWIIICLVLVGSVASPALATSFDSVNFSVKDPVLDQGQNSSASTNFGIGQSVGQFGVGKSTSANFQLLSGFQYYYKVKSNTLSGTAGDAQVALSWTAPQTYLGISIDSYEVGTGTVSGTYTYESVGAVTNFTKTGLSNGTPYYFSIKAKGVGGIVLAYSNEVTATPTASATPGGGGGGGVVTPPATNQIIFSGFASPASQVNLLQDFVLAGQTISGTEGEFSFSVDSGYNGSSNFVLFYTDPNGLRSNPVTFTVPGNQNPSFQNIVLPPTLSGSHSSVKQGDALTISGYSAPNIKILIDVLGSSLTLETTTNNSGYYRLNIPTEELPLGRYEVRATSSLAGYISKPSLSFFFEVGKENVIFRPPEKCGDHNQDGRVDIIDFSILLYWYERKNPPTRIDCNKDKIINIYDISILMFNWTG